MILRRDLPQLEALTRAAGEGLNDANSQRLKQYLQGKTEAKRQQQGKDLLNDPQIKNVVNQGGSYAVDPETGGVHIGGNPYAKLAGRGPQEAQVFLKNAQGAYKNINDQLDAQRATLDALDQGNAQGDRLAYINEAKIAAGSGGSRALGQILMQLHGDPSMAADTQKAINWIQNTPNLPTMQPAERDALRETVFGRSKQLTDQHLQTKTSLSQQGPVIAPYADTDKILQSVSSPIDQKLADIQGRQQQYEDARKKMAPQPQISQPAAANANPTTLDKLGNFFSGLMGGGASQQQQGPAAPQQQANDPAYQRMLELQKKAQMGQ